VEKAKSIQEELKQGRIGNNKNEGSEKSEPWETAKENLKKYVGHQTERL